jgi:hypothetical protein
MAKELPDTLFSTNVDQVGLNNFYKFDAPATILLNIPEVSKRQAGFQSSFTISNPSNQLLAFKVSFKRYNSLAAFHDAL